MAISRISGVPLANIAKVNGVAIANVEKISGVEKEAGVGPTVLMEDNFVGTDNDQLSGRVPDTVQYQTNVWRENVAAGRSIITTNACRSSGNGFSEGSEYDLPSADFKATMVLREKSLSYAAVAGRNTVVTADNPTWNIRIWTPDLRIYEENTQRAVATSNDPTEGTLEVTFSGQTITAVWNSPGDTDLTISYDSAAQNETIANAGIVPQRLNTYIESFKVESL